MMPLAGVRRRADEFARAVDGSDTRTVADEHRAFLALVEQLRSVESPAMRPDFAADLRSRLLDAAPDALTAPARSRGRDAALVRFPVNPRRRTAAAAAVACLVAASGVGVAAASQTALPGEALYPLKRGIEHAELQFAGSQADRGSEYLDQASTRLSEVTELSIAHADDPSTPALVTEALGDFVDESAAGGDALLAAYDDEHSPASIVRLREFTAESTRRLDALSDVIPPDANPALAAAADELSRLDQQAQVACPPCSDLPSLQLSSALNDLQRPSAGSTGGGFSSAGDSGSDPGPAGQANGGGTPASTGGIAALPDTSAGLDPSAGATPSDPQSTTATSPGNPVPSVPTGQTSAPTVPLPTISIPLPTLPSSTLVSVPLPTVVLDVPAVPVDPRGDARLP